MGRTLGKIVPVLVPLFLLTACEGRPVGATGPDGTLPLDCRVIFEIEPLPAVAMGWEAVQVDASKGVLVYTSTGTSGGNASGDSEVFRLPAAEPAAEQISFDDVRTVLLDAEGSAILYGSGEQPTSPTRLLLRTQGGEDVDLGEHIVVPSYSYESAGFHGRPKMIQDDTAVWAAQGSVMLYDGQRIETIYRDVDHVPMAPTIDGDIVAFAAFFDGVGDIFRYRIPGPLARITNDEIHDHAPVVSDERLYWVCGQGICSHSDRSGVELLDTGACTSLAAHNGQAAWIRDGRVVWLWDDMVRIVSDEDARALVVRMHAGRLAWVETPRSADSPPYEGQVVYHAAGRSFSVASIVLPQEVGHIETQPSLVLDDGLVAFCHSMVVQDAQQACSYARIVETGCDPF